MNAKLLVDMLDVGGHGVLRKHQLLADVRLAAPARQVAENFRLAARQTVLLGEALADAVDGRVGARGDAACLAGVIWLVVGEKPLKDDQLYTVATIDYLADGNGRMDAFLQAEKRVCPEDATLRGLFLDYVRKQTAEGKAITSKLDGRITIK